MHPCTNKQKCECRCTWLVQAGANVDAQCDSGLTALHVACRSQAVLVAILLLADSVDGGGLQDCRGLFSSAGDAATDASLR